MKLRLSESSACVCWMFLLLVVSCRQIPSSPSEGITTGIVTSPARPALTYYGMAKDGDSTYPAIWIADTNAQNQTAIYVATSNSLNLAFPSWTPSGNSICFTQCGMGIVPDTIKAVDVSSRTGTVPFLRRVRPIIGLSKPGSRYEISGLGATLGYAFCSSTLNLNMIAYTASNMDTITLCVIPITGGTPRVLCSSLNSEMNDYCAWSPDDSHLAYCRLDPPFGNNVIMIFNTSDWTCVDSIHVSGIIEGLSWSRGAMNKLVFSRASTFDSPYYLYYWDPKTTAIPTTNGVIGEAPCWSPDNSSIVCYNSGLMKVTPYTKNAVMVDPTIHSSVNWK